MAITHVEERCTRQLQQIADTIAAAKRIVVVTGAGISTNCGIPDFRSQDGLYSLIRSEYNAHLSSPASLKSTKGRDLFDASLWKDELSTSVFYTFIASLRRKIREDVEQTTLAHKFIRNLRDQRKLVRCYTQNIDGLEARDGLCADLARGRGSKGRFSKKAMAMPGPAPGAVPGGGLDGGCEVVPLHGDLELLRCTICRNTVTWTDKEDLLLAGKAPACDECATQDRIRRVRGKRGSAVGSLRPNVVLYGEEHPSAEAISTVTTNDLGMAPDLLLVLGTSLKVHGLKALVREFARCVHSKKNGKGRVVYVNLGQPSGSVWSGVIDYWVDMDCDAWARDVRKRRPDLWEKQAELELRTVKRPSTEDSGKEDRTHEEKENLAPTGPQRVASTKHGPPKATSKPVVPLAEADTAHTPRAQRRRPAQLPTPPPSGRGRGCRPRKGDPASAVCAAERSEADGLSPGKRKREITIWQDEGGGTQEEAPDSEEGADEPGTPSKRMRCGIRSSTA